MEGPPQQQALPHQAKVHGAHSLQKRPPALTLLALVRTVMALVRALVALDVVRALPKRTPTNHGAHGAENLDRVRALPHQAENRPAVQMVLDLARALLALDTARALLIAPGAVVPGPVWSIL